MNIVGEKVVLRAIEQQDNAMLRMLINDPETEHMVGGTSFPVSEEEQLAWYESLKERPDVLRCAIADKECPAEAVGTAILTDIDIKNAVAQIHIKLAVRGKGYGTDAIRALVCYAFDELRLHCVYATILEYNIPSQKLFEKCGFAQEGCLRGRVFKNGKYIDQYMYSILKEECAEHA